VIPELLESAIELVTFFYILYSSMSCRVDYLLQGIMDKQLSPIMLEFLAETSKNIYSPSIPDTVNTA
jgi:hypothetical protein